MSASVSSRLRSVGASPTMELAAEALRLKRAGVDVIDLGVGEPDFPTPDHVKAAAHAAIDADRPKYTVNAGIPELRAAICARYRDDYGIGFGEAETIVTSGAKQALFNTMMTLLGPGDEAITHAPGWATLHEQVRLAGAQPVIVRSYAEDGFALRAEAVLAALSSATRAIVINSPCNPTGATIDDEALGRIAGEAARRDIWILVDACYEQLVYDEQPVSLPRMLFERVRDRTVICGSTSKTYAMTGWRCGWAIAPAPVIVACNTLQGHSTSNVSSVSQYAALAALTGPQDCVRHMREEYRRRRDLAWELFTGDPRLHARKPAGAFYLFIDVTDVLSPGGLRTSAALAQALLREAHVATFPGEAFDAPGFLRISFATSADTLRRGAQRVSTFLDGLASRTPRPPAAGS